VTTPLVLLWMYFMVCLNAGSCCLLSRKYSQSVYEPESTHAGWEDIQHHGTVPPASLCHVAGMCAAVARLTVRACRIMAMTISHTSSLLPMALFSNRSLFLRSGPFQTIV
jgi:hypothetical protein